MRTNLLKTSMVLLLMVVGLSASKAFTAVTSGSWSNAATWGGVAPGATVTGQDIIIPAGIDVMLDMDVTFTGLLNSFTVNGTLSGGTNALVIDQGAFAGSGMADVTMITFNALGTTSFTGTLNADVMKNAGATLALAAIVNVSDTLNLDAGSLLLQGGANLTPMANSTVKINNGTLTISGGIFNSSTNYNVMYIGSSKTTGVELNTTMLQDFHVMLTDNTQTLTLGANLTVNGLTHLAGGVLDISGRTVTIKGNLMTAGGSTITANTTSNLFIEGATSLTNAVAFTAGSTINNFSVDLSGMGAAVMLSTPVNISGNLRLMDGDLNLQSGAVLTMNAGSTVHVEDGMMNVGAGSFAGTASYNVEYMGGSVTTGTELSGTGLNNVTVQLMPGPNMVTLAGNLTVPGVFNLNGGMLVLNGKNLVLNGTMNAMPMGMISSTTASDIILNLTSSTGDTLRFAPGANMVDDLVINIAAGSPIVLGTPLEIANQLNFQNGKINIFNSKLTIQSTGTITGYSDTKYIITGGTGKLEQKVNLAGPYVVYPVGTIQNYSPASVQQTALGTSGNFSVGVLNDVYAAGYTGASVASTNSLVTRTWFIDAATGVLVNMNLKLGWMAASEVNGFNRASSYISHYTTLWDSIAPTSAASAGTTYELTRMGITNLNTSAFSVMDKRVVAGVEELSAATFSMYPNPASSVLTINSSNQDDLSVQVLDVTGKVVMTSQLNAGSGQLDVTALDNGCYFVRAVNVSNNGVAVLKFIKQ